MTFKSIKRFLRQPAVILGELAAIASAGTLGAVLPEWHIFQSLWFAVIALFAAASLAVVVNEQFHRFRSQWPQQPSLTYFQSAPFKTEFERPATTSASQQKIWSERRLGLAGSLVFHTGLLLLIVAGAWRALFATDAVVDLIEGETLDPTTVWSAQWPGAFGKPLRLEQPITLESVSGSRYPGGDLRDLRAIFSAGEIAVNHQLHFGGSRLYLAREFGPAVLLEWNSSQRVATLLTSARPGDFTGETVAANGLKVFLRSNSERPANIEIRVMRGGGLLAAGTLGIGETVALPEGASLTLRGVPMWARLHGSHDSALWLAYLGMILTMTGAAMMFTLIKLDFCVTVTPAGEREKVFVALKPQRFAPLFQERFEKLVRKYSAVPALEEIVPILVDKDLSSPVLTAAVRGLLLMGCLVFASGCNRVSQLQAKQLVEHYNQVVAEAYRRGDVRLIDPVVGPNEGKKLTGLIGIRLDLGITLDSQLLALEITGVKQVKNSLLVSTKERWSYRDLKIGTGAQVGEASQDVYEMTYFFTNVNKSWLVDEIKFAAPPQVGRKETPWIADRSALHQTTTETKP